MIAQRVLFLSVCWAALAATCVSSPGPQEPEGVFLGHLTFNGKVVGDVYAINRTTLRIENFNLSEKDGGIVFTFGYTPTPNDTRKITPAPDKKAPVPEAMPDVSLNRLPDLLDDDDDDSLETLSCPFCEIPHSDIQLPPPSSDHRKKPITVPIPRENDPCERRFGLVTLHRQGSSTNLSILVLSNRTIERLAREICPGPLPFTLSPSTTLQSPATATSTAGATSLSPTATTSAGATSLSPTATTSAGATSLSPTATTSAGATSLSPTAAVTTSPPPSATTLPVLNCSKLTSGFGVCWENIRRSGKFTLCANDIGPGQYMAFGWSRRFRKTTMVKADAVVCSHHINGTWDVEDYYLESRQPCGANAKGERFGVCPDTAFGKASNIKDGSGFYENGVAYCTFKRRLYTSRKHDMKITVKKKQAIVWAIGPIGEEGQIRKHSKRAGPDTQLLSFVHGGQQCKLGDPKLCCENIIQQ